MRIPLFVLVAANLCFAGGPTWLAEYAQQDVKKLNKAIIFQPQLRWREAAQDGHGLVPFFADESKLPKRLGLAFFLVHDPGTAKYSNTLYSRSARMSGTDEVAAVKIATELLNASKAGLKQAFGDHGFEVLLPEEYLDTEEKKNIYTSFTPEASALMKGTVKVAQNLEMRGNLGNLLKTTATAQGMRVHDFIFEDYKTMSGLGSLAKSLGLDGIIVIHNTITTDEKFTFLNKIIFSIYGPNPVPRIEGKKYIGAMGAGYNDGLAYAQSTLDCTRGGPPAIAQLTKNKRKEIEEKGEFTVAPKLEGYEKLISFMTQSVGTYLKKCVEGAERK